MDASTQRAAWDDRAIVEPHASALSPRGAGPFELHEYRPCSLSLLREREEGTEVTFMKVAKVTRLSVGMIALVHPHGHIGIIAKKGRANVECLAHAG